MKKTAKPKAKKQQPKQWWDGKGWDGEDRDPLAYVREFCPNLVEKRASLVPFDDVICGESAGPQPQAKDYDPTETPSFMVEVRCPHYPNCQYMFRFTEHGQQMEYYEAPGDGTMRMMDDPIPMTMREIWDFLRQLPRNAQAFARALR
jgi:hypothetical protein